MVRKIQKILMRCFSKTLMKYVKTKDLVVIADGMETFDGSPKAIFLESQLNEKIKNRYFWITQNKDLYKKISKQYDNVLYAFSLKGMYYIIRAKFYIMNINTQDFFPGLKIPLNRVVIQTFHGVPTKCFGKSASTYYSKKEIKKQLEDSFNSKNMYILTASKYEDNAFHNNCEFPYDRMLRFGHPRNDALIYQEKIKKLNKNKITNDNEQKIICYCPTWRENNNFKFFPFDDSNLDELNEFLQTKNILLVVKLHPHTGNMHVDLKKYSNIIMYNKEWMIDNIQLFSIVDLIVTDYSSMYCDFLLTGKPVAFMQYDYEEYIKTRPLSNKREILYPGPNINSFKEFREETLRLMNDSNYYKKEREKALKYFYEYYKFDASKKTIDFIEKSRKKK